MLDVFVNAPNPINIKPKPKGGGGGRADLDSVWFELRQEFDDTVYRYIVN